MGFCKTRPRWRWTINNITVRESNHRFGIAGANHNHADAARCGRYAVVARLFLLITAYAGLPERLSAIQLDREAHDETSQTDRPGNRIDRRHAGRCGRGPRTAALQPA